MDEDTLEFRPNSWLRGWKEYVIDFPFQNLDKVKRLKLNTSDIDQDYIVFLLNKYFEVFKSLKFLHLYCDRVYPKLSLNWPTFCFKVQTRFGKKWEVKSLKRTSREINRSLPIAAFERSNPQVDVNDPRKFLKIADLDITAEQVIAAIPWGGSSFRTIYKMFGPDNYSAEAEEKLCKILLYDFHADFDYPRRHFAHNGVGEMVL